MGLGVHPSSPAIVFIMSGYRCVEVALLVRLSTVATVIDSRPLDMAFQ